MASNGIERKEHPAARYVSSMPLEAAPIDEEELKLLTPPPPTHDRVTPFLLPTPGFIENSMDQEQPPDSFWGIPIWKAFPNLYDIRQHSPVHSSVRPHPFVSQFVSICPSLVDLAVGHVIDSAAALATAGLLGTIPGVYLRRSASLGSKLVAGALTGVVSASLFFPVYRYSLYKLRVRALLEQDRKVPTRPAIPMSARRAWIGMDEEGNVKQTFGYFTNNPYQTWEDYQLNGPGRKVLETVYRKIDEEKLKEALQKRQERDLKAVETKRAQQQH